MVHNLSEYREVDYPINDIFRDRWSPRAMSGETLTKEELTPLFEAARWAPSSYNNQPWRFLYAGRDTENWNTFFNLLVEFNQSWAKQASFLIVIVAKKTFDNGEPCITHSFDTGAAWQNLALQGSANNLVVHGMQGFDYDKARTDLSIPDEYEVMAMAAVGKPGKLDNLPEGLREKEKPSDRKSVSEIAFEGTFSKRK